MIIVVELNSNKSLVWKNIDYKTTSSNLSVRDYVVYCLCEKVEKESAKGIAL
jgi:hypothetical protein